jgi:putative hydroxymethylpyrimidine transport system ATP-binding protein
MPILLRDVSFSYHHKVLFKNFNLELPDNKCVCLLGASGVGKTTLLRLIAGLETSTDPGSLQADISRNSGNISYMAQQDLLLPWLTVLDNVLLGYRLRKNLTKQIKKQALEMLAHVGLEKTAKQLPATLSSGMRQRVAVARTLLENRSVILMDEPFSALDAINRLYLQNLVATMFSNRTVLLVTHDPLEALRLADIIYVLAGSPVSLSEPILPANQAPRDPTDPKLLKLQAELLQKLLAAHEANYADSN